MSFERSWILDDLLNCNATFKWTIGSKFRIFQCIVLVSVFKGKGFVTAWQFAVKLTPIE